jgi:hypothetical protein
VSIDGIPGSGGVGPQLVLNYCCYRRCSALQAATGEGELRAPRCSDAAHLASSRGGRGDRRAQLDVVGSGDPGRGRRRVDNIVERQPWWWEVPAASSSHSRLVCSGGGSRGATVIIVARPFHHLHTAGLLAAPTPPLPTATADQARPPSPFSSDGSKLSRSSFFSTTSFSPPWLQIRVCPLLLSPPSTSEIHRIP